MNRRLGLSILGILVLITTVICFRESGTQSRDSSSEWKKTPGLSSHEGKPAQGEVDKDASDQPIDVRPFEASDEAARAPRVVITVRVVDPLGNAQNDVPVGLRTATGLPFVQARTDTEGRALLSLDDETIERLERASDDYYGIAILDVLPRGTDYPLKRRALPTEEVTLVIPLTGSLRVQIDNADGTPFLSPLPFRVIVNRVGDPSATDSSDSIVRLLAQGEAHFPRVGLDSSLAIVVGDEDGTRDPLTLKAQGPIKAGEEVHVPGVMTPLRPMVTGRILGLDGKPKRNAELESRLCDLKGDWVSRQPIRDVSTDDEGRFRIIISDAAPKKDFSRELLISQAREPSQSWHYAVAKLNQRLPPGITDLGDLGLKEEQLLVTGVVVDPDGSPIEGAWINVFRKVPHYLRPTRIETIMVDRVFSLVRSRPSGSEGRFTYYGLPGAPPLIQVRASAGGWIDSEIEVAPGTRDLRIQLHRGGSFRCKIQLEEGLTDQEMFVGLRPQKAGDHSGFGRDRFPPGGSYQRAALSPGTYRLMIGTMDPFRLVHEVRDIQILEGKTVDLGTIEIEIKERKFVIEVVDTEGNPIPRCTTGIITTDGSFDRASFRKGRAIFRPLEGEGPILIMSPGYKDVELDAANPPLRVALKEAPRVILQLQNLGDVPPGCQLKLRYGRSLRTQNEGKIRRRPRHSPGSFRPKLEKGDYILPLGETGLHRVFFALRKGRTYARRMIDVEVNVPDTPGIHRIPFRLDPELLHKLAEALPPR